MNCFFEALKEIDQFNKLTEDLKKSGVYGVNGLADTQKAHFLAAIANQTGKRLCIVSWSEVSAKNLLEDMEPFCHKTAFLPAADFMPSDTFAASYELTGDRVRALDKIENGASAAFSAASMLGFVLTEKEKTVIEKGKTVHIENLAERLTQTGYKRVYAAEGDGQFAVRGGIIDVFPPTEEFPLRIELFGDEVESIRKYDPETQVSFEETENCVIGWASADLGEGSVLEYFDDNTIFVFDEPQRVRESALGFKKHADEKIADFMMKGKIDKAKEKYFNDYDELIASLSGKTVLLVGALTCASDDFKAKKTVSISGQIMPSYAGNTALLAEDTKFFAEEKYRIFVFAGNRTKAQGVLKALADSGREAIIAKDYSLPERGVVTIYESPLRKGFKYTASKTVFISGNDIFNRRDRRQVRVGSAKNAIRSFDELASGDFVVHRAHGVGKFEGLTKIERDGVTKDYFKITYRGSDVLYVPVNQLNLLYKYSHAGDEAKEPRLNKLGGAEWNNTKTSVKKSVRDIAIKLIDLYAMRTKEVGHAFSEDTPWQREFESEFIYEETPDQLTSIEEVKKDMEKSKPMDRLLCGDVGYGKTEVAIRAAFKCIMDGHQCAYLVPTTILAMQHFNHFAERMRNFPVKIEMLSRFKTATQQKKIINKLSTGEIDIVIGTHKLLSEKVEFKKLGLLIIDEEQRFGVEHKEKIKNLKKGIDVLTLTATPIPRTLNMAMTGIRDMSIIARPPEDRHPIQTYVTEHDDFLVRDAISKEIARGGQVYYVYNRIAGIYSVATKLQEMMPELRIAVAHGRMNEAELENIMLKMLDGEVDVLVCTTIIETGIDIQNVNTIIIENADRMGLAQLYQLRGRVGRSNRIAYAYLTFRKDKELSEVSSKRLAAIKEFTELGSGFKVAMRDLEIRGAGNLLGAEQHGFITSVGYDMFVRLINETVNELSGREDKNKEATVDINVTARIPEHYIEGAQQRLEAYRQIAEIETDGGAEAIRAELADRYGTVPEETLTLIDISLIRNYAKEACIDEISQKGDNINLYFDKKGPSMEKVSEAIENHWGDILFSAGKRPYLSLRPDFFKGQNKTDEIKKMLKDLKED